VKKILKMLKAVNDLPGKIKPDPQKDTSHTHIAEEKGHGYG
jgi:hypothetical protein